MLNGMLAWNPSPPRTPARIPCHLSTTLAFPCQLPLPSFTSSFISWHAHNYNFFWPLQALVVDMEPYHWVTGMGGPHTHPFTMRACIVGPPPWVSLTPLNPPCNKVSWVWLTVPPSGQLYHTNSTSTCHWG
jgi:hypothetical protein